MARKTRVMTGGKKRSTRIVTAGQNKARNQGIVNTPVFHASTVLYPSMAAMREAVRNRDKTLYYGRRGTPTTMTLAEALADLEGGAGCVLYPSGLAAITHALMAFLKTGDHLLMVDTAYEPTRAFCDKVLKGWGIETTYYAPGIGAGIAALFRDNTRVVFTESPGSLTFEMQDIPAIAKEAHQRGAIVMLDNTWASPILFRPFEKGVDISIQALTKYVVGHSDAMLGSATATEKVLPQLLESRNLLGASVGPDDVYLATRGLRTLEVRLRQQGENALAVARWLEGRTEVDRVLHPALESHPDHAIWKRDFNGSSGLFAFVLKEGTQQAVDAMMDGFRYFGIGYSWGGFESLAIPANPFRTARPWAGPGPLIRLHVGLEDPADLIEDLEEGFARLKKA
jgi:cystathionine beta-lyase